MTGQAAYKSRYVLVTHKKGPWYRALKHCESLHETAHLVCIRNDEQRDALSAFLWNNRGQQLRCVFQSTIT